MKKIGVIGAGTMGIGITQIIAQAGVKVILKDINEEELIKGINNIKKNLSKCIEQGHINLDEKESILKNITTTTTYALLNDVDLVIEAVVEDMAIKKDIFKQLDENCPSETILVSNTSSLSITELAVSTSRPDKVMGMHFFNPVPVMTLVELIKTMMTSDKTFKDVQQFAEKLDKKPIKVKESPGFIVNRILIPMINEAIFLLSENVASAKAIDKAMKLGANHPIGPLALADLIGLDICLNIMEDLYEAFQDPKYRSCPLLRTMVRAKKLGRKTKEGFYNYQ